MFNIGESFYHHIQNKENEIIDLIAIIRKIIISDHHHLLEILQRKVKDYGQIIFLLNENQVIQLNQLNKDIIQKANPFLLKEQIQTKKEKYKQNLQIVEQSEIKYQKLFEKLSEIEKKEIEISKQITQRQSDFQQQSLHIKCSEKIFHLQNQLNDQINFNKFEIKDKKTIQLTEQIDKQIQTSSRNENLKNNGSKVVSNDDPFSHRIINESFNQSLQLNTSILRENSELLQKGLGIRQLLKEKLSKYQNDCEKFVQLIIEQKKLKNRSQTEVKFYTELGKMLEKMKEDNSRLESAFQNYTQEQDQKDQQLKQLFEKTLQSVKLLKETVLEETMNLNEILARKVQFNEELQYLIQKKQELIKEQEQKANSQNEIIQETKNQIHQQENYIDRLQGQIQNLNQNISSLQFNFDQQLDQKKQLQQNVNLYFYPKYRTYSLIYVSKNQKKFKGI